MEKKENQLLKILQKQDFETLYQNYKTTIYHIAFSILKQRADSEEVVQNVFLKLLRMQPDTLPKKNAYVWLYQVVKNEAFQLIRKQKKEIALEEIYEIGIEDKELEEKLQNQDYQKLISQLNPKEQQVVNLKIIGNFTFREIGKLLGIPIATVQWRYYTALHTLRYLLGNIAMTIIGVIATFRSQHFDTTKETNQMEEVKNETEREMPKQELSEDSIKNTIQQEEIKQEIKLPTEDRMQKDISISIFSITTIFLCFSIFFTFLILKHHYRLKRKK